MSVTPIEPTPAPTHGPAQGQPGPAQGQGSPAPAPTPPEPHGEGQPDTTDWKAMARKWEANAKANADAAAKLKAIEDAAKTTEQLMTEQMAELQAKVTQLTADQQHTAWRTQVATATGLPLDVIANLRGDTLEELQAAAATVQALATKKPAAPPVVPNEGTLPGTTLTTTTPGLGTLHEAGSSPHSRGTESPRRVRRLRFL